MGLRGKAKRSAVQQEHCPMPAESLQKETHAALLFSHLEVKRVYIQAEKVPPKVRVQEMGVGLVCSAFFFFLWKLMEAAK